MTATLDAVASKKKDKPEPTAEERAAEELVRRAREQGLSLTGPDGLLKQLTKMLLETALDQEMTEHLGHEKNGPVLNETGNVRNGSRAKTVLTVGTGEVGIDVPRDRDGTFQPQIVRKRQRRLTGVDEIVLSLYAKGLTTGEISAHFAEIYGASVSKETVSRITDRVIEEMQAWQSRPQGRLLRRLRRAQRPARGGGERLAGRHRADLHRAPDPQHLPPGLKEGLGRPQARRETGLHRGERHRRPGRARRARREVGQPLPGRHPAVGERLERIHPVPGLRSLSQIRDGC
jgi:Transposase, Mutator family